VEPLRVTYKDVDVSAYAQYGITTGVLKPFDPKETKTCMILSQGWPSWFWAARARGYDIKIVILSNVLWKTTILQHSPLTKVLVWSQDLEIPFESIQVIFSDFDLKGPLKDLWMYVTHFVILPRAARTKPQGWLEVKLSLSHFEMGGVTDGTWIIHIYCSEAIPGLMVPKQAARDASTVLNAMETGGYPCNAPNLPALDSLTQPMVTLVREGVYYGKGLLPWRTQTPKVVTPNVFSPTRWVCRKITTEERLFSRDLTKFMLQNLNQQSLKFLAADDGYLPDKCCLGLLDSFGNKSGTNLERNVINNYKVNCPPKLGEVVNSPHVSMGVGEDEIEDRLFRERSAKRIQAATKADNAEIPWELWDGRLLPHVDPDIRKGVLEPLRMLFLRRWRQNVRTSFLNWFKAKYPFCLTVAGLDWRKIHANAECRIDWWAGRDCVRRCCLASWWEWDAGSRPLHWRWPAEYQQVIRDGLKPWLDRKPSEYTVPQRGEPDPKIRLKVKEKLAKVRRKGYLAEGLVKSLTSFFTVPKGDDDVRVVYNGTKSGLNDCLWAPWFRLPTIEQHLRAVEAGTYLSDLDIAEQFHNFIMHLDLQPYAGVDVTSFFPEEVLSQRSTKRTKQTIWLRWTRCGMGFKMSPYNAGQAMLFAEEVIRGDPLNPSNPFGFDMVCLNSPGSANYDPARPWVFKCHRSTGKLANDFFVYVDDVRATGGNERDCWACSRTIASWYSYLGLQNAPRKRRGPSQEAGPWAGSTVHTSNETVTVTVTFDRWTKAQAMITWISDHVERLIPMLHKQLESVRGSLVYLSRTYPALVPYLKGIHLTLDSWRPNRDSQGWKTQPLSDVELDGLTLPSSTANNPPEYISAVGQLTADIAALRLLFSPSYPPKRAVRPQATATAAYGFGDASGSGFGTTLLIQGTIHYRHGQWSTMESESSSNYRELHNLILGIEEAVSAGVLNNTELFLFTDNTSAEAAFHKGTSSSKTLFNLVLRLRVLQMHCGLFLHVIHVAGSRMQAQGTDDLSRGTLASGVLRGVDMLSFVPLHLSALDRSPALSQWVSSWAPGELTWLQPFDWYTIGHRPACHVWTPPPSAAEVALEQLAAATHKRPNQHHIVIIPRLYTSHWRRLLGKICDLVFTVPLGTPFWPANMFEPLLIGLYLPLLSFSPWQFRRTSLLDHVAGQLSSLPRATHDWGGGYSAPTFRPNGGLGHLVTAPGTADVTRRPTKASSRLPGLRMRRESLWYLTQRMKCDSWRPETVTTWFALSSAISAISLT
jgi:hypothetical protein